MYTLFILKLVGGATGDEFGASLLSLHDLNGDGIDDLVVGAPGEDSAGTGAGAVYVYTGVSSGYLDTENPSVIFGAAAGDGFGRHLAIGDVDGDGAEDLAVYGDGCECVSIVSTLDAFASRAILTGTTGTQFGASLDLGDVNGDGYSDLVVGASGDDTNGVDAGAAYVYSGSASGLSASPDTILLGEGAGDGFGTAVLDSLDADGDGDDEVVVGAPAGGANDWGAAYAWYGDPAGIGAAYDWSDESASQWDYGAQLAPGDFNGDGYGDVLIVGFDLNGGTEKASGSASGFGSITSGLRVLGYLDSVVTGPGADGDGDGADDLPYQVTQSDDSDWDCYDVPRVGSGFADALDLPDAVSIAGAGDQVAGATDELWVATAGGAGTVYLAVSAEDADGDGYLSGVLDTLADCDDGDRAVHPNALETDGDGLDSDCDGADDAAISTSPPTCRSAASLPEALALLDADQRVSTDVPGWVAEAEGALSGRYIVAGSDGDHVWSRAWLPSTDTLSGNLLQGWDDRASVYELWPEECVYSSSSTSILAFDLQWATPTSTGLAPMRAAHSSHDDSDTYAGHGTWSDGTERAFYTTVRSGHSEYESYTSFWNYDFEGLTETSDGCAFSYDYIDGDYDSGMFEGTLWSFDDGVHTAEVSVRFTDAGCDQSHWTVGRLDGGPWRPIDPTTWTDLGTTDADGDGWPADAGDCDDADATVNPCAVETEACVDQNCDGYVEDRDRDGVLDCDDCDSRDETVGVGVEWFGEDDDGDGYGDVSLGPACEAPGDGSSTVPDCDDSDARISPEGEEDCNGVDDDCDGAVDERATVAHFLDLDGDGYGSEAVPAPDDRACEGTTVGGDCDDLDPATFPGAPEVPDDGFDQDCDGEDFSPGSGKGEAPAEPGCFGGSALLFGALGLAGGVRRRRARVPAA